MSYSTVVLYIRDHGGLYFLTKGIDQKLASLTVLVRYNQCWDSYFVKVTSYILHITCN